jgi:DNA-binding NtrC family response regulator
MREIEKEYILATLTRLKNNKARTAQALGISEKTLYNKLYRYSGRGTRQERDDDRSESVSQPAKANNG